MQHIDLVDPTAPLPLGPRESVSGAGGTLRGRTVGVIDNVHWTQWPLFLTELEAALVREDARMLRIEADASGLFSSGPRPTDPEWDRFAATSDVTIGGLGA